MVKIDASVIEESLWDYPKPFTIRRCASAKDADGYGHINNSVYLKWLDLCVWRHCDDVGMPPARCRELNRGMAVIRHEIDYLKSAYPNDELVIANWVTANDGKLRAEREFQIIRLSGQYYGL